MNSNLFLSDVINKNISLAKSSVRNQFKNLLFQFCEENNLDLNQPPINKEENTTQTNLPQKDVNSYVDLTNLAVDALNFDLQNAYQKHPESRVLAKKLLDLKHISSTESPKALQQIISLIKLDNPNVKEITSNIDFEVFNYLINLIKDLMFVSSKSFDSSLISKDLSNLKQSENLDPVTAEKMSENIQKKLQEYVDSSTTPPDVT